MRSAFTHFIIHTERSVRDQNKPLNINRGRFGYRVAADYSITQSNWSMSHHWWWWWWWWWWYVITEFFCFLSSPTTTNVTFLYCNLHWRKRPLPRWENCNGTFYVNDKDDTRNVTLSGKSSRDTCFLLKFTPNLFNHIWNRIQCITLSCSCAIIWF